MASIVLPTLISHTHGRQRRVERQIERKELQEAVKHGRKERANPGRGGERRWRFTHKSVVYVTDESCRHEITSWRLLEDEVHEAMVSSAGAVGAHAVIVVDNSGSMRKNDVPNYETRTAAVYDCLARDLVEPQLKKTIPGDVAVTVIEMSSEASVVCDRAPLDGDLKAFLRRRMVQRAKSHGNYLPALDKVVEKFKDEARTSSKQLFLLFLSDGAPSDHMSMLCEHDVAVWQPDITKAHIFTKNGRDFLNNCPRSQLCRRAIHERVQRDCVRKVRHLVDLFGRDRVFVGTVAFGPPKEDYAVLQKMAEAVPRHSFQKLGLSATGLATAFTSLTSSLTTMRSSVLVDSAVLTKRTDFEKKTWDGGARIDHDDVLSRLDYDVYDPEKVHSKSQWCPMKRALVRAPFAQDGCGVAHAKYYFAQGAERVAFHATEIDADRRPVGPMLVAKVSHYHEFAYDRQYHETFCRTLSEADGLAALFNRRVNAGPETQVHYVQAVVYDVHEDRRDISWTGSVSFLAEPELEGKFTKWSNNNGVVKRFDAARAHHHHNHQGGNQAPEGGNRDIRGGFAIIEEEEEDDDEEDDDEEDDVFAMRELKGVTELLTVDVADVPQAFSHFTHSVTHGVKLVCDIQGVWNPTDGFLLTDPVIHSLKKKTTNGATDKGKAGIDKFFETHKCNALCRRLGLDDG